MMPNSRSGMEMEKPVVNILVAGKVSPELVHYIGWGLEEESIPASLNRVTKEADASVLAKQAAMESRLHVGIGVSGRQGEAALYHRDMPHEKPILTAPVSETSREALIGLGKNAARLVKGNPFCFEYENRISDSEPVSGLEYSPDTIEKIVSGVVEALLNHS